jgi:hypothetical protein
VRQAFLLRDFEHTQTNSFGDLSFHGWGLGQEIEINAMMSEGGLTKVIVGVMTPEAESETAFLSLRSTLQAKYGPPPDVEDLSCYWLDEGGGYGMALQLTESGFIAITYESPGWGREADRRRHLRLSDF